MANIFAGDREYETKGMYIRDFNPKRPVPDSGRDGYFMNCLGFLISAGCGKIGGVFVAKDMIGYNQPLYFRRPFINGKHPGIAVKAFDRIVFDKPVAAMDL